MAKCPAGKHKATRGPSKGRKCIPNKGKGKGKKRCPPCPCPKKGKKKCPTGMRRVKGKCSPHIKPWSQEVLADFPMFGR